MNRRNFTRATMVQIIKRATDNVGVIRCEKCQGVCVRFHVHHLAMDAMQVDKSAKLTEKEGQLLCEPCHKEITTAQMPVLAKSLRVEAKHLRAVKPAGKIKSAPFAKSAKPKHERKELPPRKLFV